MITIDGFPIDAAISETHEFESDVTAYPVESGATVTDNVRKKPIVVTIEGIVSDTPLGEVALHRFTRSQFTQERFPLAYVPSADALDRLLGIRDKGEPVTIETGLRVYQSMVLSSLLVPRDSKTGRALRFTAVFTQVVIITNVRTRIRVASPAATPSGKTKISSGTGVVIVNRGPQEVTTLSGRNAVWDDKKGRYVYSEDFPGGGGQPVPQGDLGDLSKYDGKITPVPASGEQLDPEPNSTYYDFQDDEWKNTDGSSVTQQQLDQKRDLKTQTAVDNSDPNSSFHKPWWVGHN